VKSEKTSVVSQSNLIVDAISSQHVFVFSGPTALVERIDWHMQVKIVVTKGRDISMHPL
jgi:hypothetical protein